MNRASLAVFAGVLLAGLLRVAAADSPTNALAGSIPRFDIRLDPASRDRLRRDPRSDVSATVSIDGIPISGTTLHLKGSVGSFRPIDDHPSLTLRFDRLDPGGILAGIPRLHLNNSREDPTRLHEVTGYELFRRAGLDAPAAGHARVTLDGRDLGLAVMREGFGGEYHARHFGTRGGILEPFPTEDIDGRSTLHGHGARPDHAAIGAAFELVDPEESWRAVSGRIDAERFADFAVAEVFAGHRDGYVMARNNYRYRVDPVTGKLRFLPHGLDQIFDNASIPWRPEAAGKAARAMLRSDEGRALYERRFRALFPVLGDVGSLDAFVDATHERILAALRPEERPGQRARTVEFKERIHARIADLSRQLAAADPAEPRWAGGRARIDGWAPFAAPDGGSMDLATNRASGAVELHVAAGKTTAASWRATVILPAGRYRFTGKARTKGVEPLPFGKTQGAALRVLGTDHRSEGRIGTTASGEVSVEFELGARAPTGLACELRASGGDAWFDPASLVIVRLTP